jgi:hypothetical protein
MWDCMNSYWLKIGGRGKVRIKIKNLGNTVAPFLTPLAGEEFLEWLPRRLD